MASKPGILTDWPWTPLGSFKVSLTFNFPPIISQSHFHASCMAIYIYIYILRSSNAFVLLFHGFLQYIILIPWITESIYSFIVKDEKERDLTNVFIFPLMLWRMLHNQLWISLSRYRTAKGSNRIVDKSIEFDQVDRERNWSVTKLIKVHSTGHVYRKI